ncbi:hypothetical protein K1719_035369 [Acacia pycnantha]|nr:hypothetical protein K1719_035369 [Acacia pycnantha]
MLFEEIPNKDLLPGQQRYVESYGIWNSEWLEALSLFRRMRSEGLRPHALIIASIFPICGRLEAVQLGKAWQGCAIRSGLDTDLYVSNALMDMYCKCYNPLDAYRIFYHMNDQNEFHNKCNCCDKRSKLGKAMRNFVLQHGLVSDVVVGSAFVDIYVQQMWISRSGSQGLQPNDDEDVTYNTIISAYGIYGLGEQGLIFYEQMKMEGIRPNRVTFTALSSACSHAGLTDRGWAMYNSMIKYYGIEPNMEHYSCMVDLLRRAGDLEAVYI